MSRERINKAIETMVSRYPDASLVKNKYKVISASIMQCYPVTKDLGRATMEAIIDDAIHLDRKWRQLTEGKDQENKKILSQEKQIELGYEPGFNRKFAQYRN